MDITPQTNINELINVFPQLEETLIALNPQFEKLRNPLLRNSIGRIATLKQAAAIVNIPSLQLTNHLREAVGQAPLKIGR